MIRQRCLVLARSAVAFCPVCHGTGRVSLQAIPDGDPVEWKCMHCTSPDHLPIVHLPAYVDRRAS